MEELEIMQKSEETTSYSKLLEVLYASLQTEKGFEQFIDHLKDYFNNCSVALLVIAKEPRQMQWAWTMGVSIGFERWYKENNMAIKDLSFAQMEIISAKTEGFVSTGSLLKSIDLVDAVAENLKPWLVKEAIVDCAGLVIPAFQQSHVLLTLHRSNSVGKFSELEIKQLNLLVPHIKQAAMLLVKFYYNQYDKLTIDAIKSYLKLTQTEAIICRLLVDGLCLKDIARKRNVSVHTVREQVRQIYQKTGFKRQSEVVAAILRKAA
jgi:DNA-binding CsgD family transcriptional regulator